MALEGLNRQLGGGFVLIQHQRLILNHLIAVVPLPYDDADGGIGGNRTRHVDRLVVDEVGGGFGEALWGVCREGIKGRCEALWGAS